MLARGNELLESNDIIGARLMFERAAAAGSAAAAVRAGITYDPGYLASLGPQRTLSNPAAAARWYRTAISLGDTQAREFLTRLEATGARR